MKLQELLTKEGIDAQRQGHLIMVKKGQHINMLVGKLTFMPSCESQAIRHVNALMQGPENLLMCGDWFKVEEFLNKHGFEGDYFLTKSGTMCRLNNTNDYIAAIRAEFNI